MGTSRLTTVPDLPTRQAREGLAGAALDREGGSGGETTTGRGGYFSGL